jgi:hypothetical protein
MAHFVVMMMLWNQEKKSSRMHLYKKLDEEDETNG